MGLFDFLKKKDNKTVNNIDDTPENLFQLINRYSEYIIYFINLHQRNDYAPIAAYQKKNGEIIGLVYIIKDNDYVPSSIDIVTKMELDFEKKMADKQIISYTIFYHSPFANDDNHEVANDEKDLKAISIAYHFSNGMKGKIGLPYVFTDEGISYLGFSNFNASENGIIFNTQLEQNKQYFEVGEELKPEEIENEIGIKIIKSNTYDLENTWCGIFGFESFRKPEGSLPLRKLIIASKLDNNSYTANHITIFTMDFPDVRFKSFSLPNLQNTALPVIKTDYTIEVENLEINEWENASDLEAVIKGRGRDTFGIIYFATDYVENRELYLTKKKLPVKISGIVFVLDLYKGNKSKEIEYSEDFTAYMPNTDLVKYGCFDFIGHLEGFRETYLLEDNSLKAYIMQVRLITHPEQRDFFTIDMYVTPENMRFSNLEIGMKLTGMFQMQGQINT